MLVNRKMAEQAAADLGLALHDGMNEETVKYAYKIMAKLTHPDTGGTVIAFAAVDRAKHVLLAWLAKPKPAVEEQLKQPCPTCGGTGYVMQPRGFKPGLRVQCRQCRGSGDMGLDVDRTAEGL